LLNSFIKFSVPSLLVAAASLAQAAQLSTDARGAIPRDVQQLVVIDYRAMENSTAAMNLRNRVMPPELKQFDEALTKSGLNENHDVDQLAFALFRPSPNSDALQTVGIAQGQFDTDSVLATFRKQKVKPAMVRTNSIYPMTKTGMMLCFVDASTMIFGTKEAVTKALDARDGNTPSMLTNGTLMGAMQSGFRRVVEHPRRQGHAGDDAPASGRSRIGDRLRYREAAAPGLVVRDGLPARRALRSHHSNRRHVYRGHDFFTDDSRFGDAQDERY